MPATTFGGGDRAISYNYEAEAMARAMAPIDQVFIAADGTFSVTFHPSATSGEIADANALLGGTASLKLTLRAYASYARWRKEVAGISFNPGSGAFLVPTDERSRLLSQVAVSMGDDTAPFIVRGVVRATLSGTEFGIMLAAIAAHVEGTFTTLASVLAAIEANTITTKDAIDAAFA